MSCTVGRRGGFSAWREAHQSDYLAGVKAAIQASIDAGVIERRPVDPLAHVILGSFNEAALLIVPSWDPKATRAEVSAKSPTACGAGFASDIR